MGEFGENPIESIVRPSLNFANEKYGQMGKIGLGLLAVGLVASSAPLALAGAGAYFGSKIYGRVIAPKLNEFVDEASRSIED
jgi:hypothetical protein